MKQAAAYLSLMALVAGSALALPPEKVQELQAKGISNWTPGQGKGQGPVFVNLPQGIPGTAAPEAGRDTQTMQYDNGTLSALPTTFGQVYGNRFDLGVGGVQLDTVTLNSFQFYFMEDSAPDTGLFIQPSDPVNTMSINARTSANITGLMNSGPNFSAPVLNVVDASMLGTSNMFTDTFYLGGWCLNSVTMLPVNNETIGLAAAGPQTKGFTSTSGTGAVAFSNQNFNAIMRANVSSPSLVPVELMNFGVE